MDKKGNEKYYKLKEFENFANASQLYVFWFDNIQFFFI